jgi:hypothetical protein
MSEYTVPDILPSKFTKEHNRSRWTMQCDFGELIVGVLDARAVAEAVALQLYEKIIDMYDGGMRIDGSVIPRTHVWKRVRGRTYTRLERANFYKLQINGKWPIEPQHPHGTSKKIKALYHAQQFDEQNKMRTAKQRIKEIARQAKILAKYSVAVRGYKRNKTRAMNKKRHYTYKGRVLYPMAYSSGGKDSGMLRDNLKMGKASNFKNQPGFGGQVTTQCTMRISVPKALMARVYGTKLFDITPGKAPEVAGEEPANKNAVGTGAAAPAVQKEVETALKEIVKDSIVGTLAKKGTRKRSGLRMKVNYRLMYRIALNVVKYIQSAG